MQNMLRMIGYGENIGSGFPQILDITDAKELCIKKEVSYKGLFQNHAIHHQMGTSNPKRIGNKLGIGKRKSPF